MQLPRILLMFLLLAPMAQARDIPVQAGAHSLQQAILAASAGDVLILGPGTYPGPVEIDRPLTLEGGGKAVIDGNYKGTVVTITGDDVTLKGLAVTRSGTVNQFLDSGIKVMKGADRALIENNTLTDNMHGIDIHGGIDAVARNNTIIGRQNAHMIERGNGFYVWNSPGAVIENNAVRYGRDGIFSNASKKDTYRNNLFRDLRFAVHYMYTSDSEVSGNISIGNHLGLAIMFSDRVVVKDNLSLYDRSHGLMLNFANKSDISGNLVRGAEKCTFIYNANRNLIVGNRFEGCDIGIHFTAGSEKNALTENAFVGNREQVKYVGTRDIEWSLEGRGNYWSDHPAFDLNGDGLADSPFRPNDLMDSILWSQPSASLLLGSPAVQLIRWSQASFPATMPGGVVDSHPLMAPIDIAVPAEIAQMAAEVADRWQKVTLDDPELDAETTH
jgi:nitrous oxidase accessory protein